jgi:hypothetical protein
MIMSKEIWTFSQQPVKLTQLSKERLRIKVNKFIASSERLKNEVNRMDIRAGRIYLYQLVEQYTADRVDVEYIRPLIDGKYLEFPMARITLYDQDGIKCTADWIRHTGQWVSLTESDLDECLLFIEENPQWFN